jgi:AbrB family looped-hinge helix DNA binding protein
MGAQGRVVIPSSLRRELDLHAGDELVAHRDGEKLVLEKRDGLLREIQAEFRAGRGERSLVDELISQRRREARRERGR